MLRNFLHVSTLLTLWTGLAGCGEVENPGPDAGSSDAARAPDDAAVPDADEYDAGTARDAGELPACSPSLTLTPTVAAVLPFDLLTLAASGGTGAYRFELLEDASGAIVNPLTGAYLSGDRHGAIDIVELTDLGCIGRAEVRIQVVTNLKLRPSAVVALPGTTFKFDVADGSGRFGFRKRLAGSGGSISSDGLYVAGPSAGLDLVEVLDMGTGEMVTAEVLVETGSRLRAVPSVLYLGIGETFDFEVSGGSGWVDMLGAHDGFDLVEPSTIVGRSVSDRTVTLRDRYTRQEASLTVRVVEPQHFEGARSGDNLLASTLIAHDLDHDGRSEILFAHPEADVEAVNGGALFVYSRTSTGGEFILRQVLPGAERRGELGRSLAVGDFDGDGRFDVALGAPRSDSAGAADRGSVFLHRGRMDGSFEPSPMRTLAGRFGSDLFGWSLAACDFNADGRVDLAVGSLTAEDRDRSPLPTDQGAVRIFLGRAEGFRDQADFNLWGDLPDGAGGWDGRSGLRFGAALATGDFDGDGVCDLAVGGSGYDQANQNTDDGLVYVHRGLAASPGNLGGLERRPSVAWVNDNPSDRGGTFGRSLLMADLDGDGRTELITSHHGFDAGSGDSHGAVRVFRGRVLAGPIDALGSVGEADWNFVGDGSGDNTGFALAAKDVSGDGRIDLLIGNLNDEVSDSPANTGTVLVFTGRDRILPEAEPVRRSSGVAGNDRFGAALTVIDDVDVDGLPELSVLAAGSDRFGEDYGALHLVSSQAREGSVLAFPGEASGSRVGAAADFAGDLDGDGLIDMVVGAPNMPLRGQGLNAGAALIYRGTLSGFSHEPLVLAGFSQHSVGDLFGVSVSRAGDFDGDGRADLAVVARFEDFSNSYPSAQFVVDSTCPRNARSDVGAVLVFLGKSDGLPAEPSFVFYGPQPSQGIIEVVGGFDSNGDGQDDLAVSSTDWDRPAAQNVGGFMVIRGRAPVANRIVVSCAGDLLFLGRATGDSMGRSLAPLGDLDGDGCDELAIGAPGEDAVVANEGAVRVVFGWGGAGCAAAPEMLVLRGGLVSSQAGFALAGHATDVDADGLPDLAVGLPGRILGGAAVGGAAVVSGAYLRGLTREQATDSGAPNAFHPLVDPAGSTALALGARADGRLGSSVALLSLGGRGALVAGSPGVAWSGGASLWRFSESGLDPLPHAAFGGEGRRGGLFGERVAAGLLEMRPQVLVGGSDGSGVSLDAGALYVLDLGP